MELKFVCPRWGNAHLPWPKFLEKVISNGYNAVEIDLPLGAEKKEITDVLKSNKISFIGQHWQTQTVDFKTHKENYKRELYNLCEAEPLLINSHTGRDIFSFQQNMELLVLAHEIETETGCKITHETHRTRFSFAAHATFPYLKELPFLKLTTDISHWCVVAESLLADQKETLKLAIKRTHHLHARIGAPQNIQLIDPFDSNYTTERNQFFSWWMAILKTAELRGDKSFTITPEYGPFPYGLYQQNSEIPLGNQWEINAAVRDVILKMWNERDGS